MTAKYDLSRRTTVDSMIWSGGLFRRYPSAVVPFVALVVLETTFRWFSVTGSELVLLVLLTSARGYVDLCAADDLLDNDRGVLGRAWCVVRRLHVAVVARGLSVAVLVIPFIPVLFGFAVLAGVAEGFSLSLYSFIGVLIVAGLLVLVGVVVAVAIHVKLFFVSEACFVGGAGIVGSLKESWRSVSLGRVKIVILVGIFSLIVGLLLSGVVSDGGGDGESFLRVGSSAVTTAFYSALFTHIYVERRFERDEPVHTPSETASGSSTSTSP